MYLDPQCPSFQSGGPEEEHIGQYCCWGRIKGKKSQTTPLHLSQGSSNLPVLKNTDLG